MYRVASLLQTRVYKKTSCIKKFFEKCSTKKRSILVSIDFGKTVRQIFKIWPVDKVIDYIEFEIIYPCVL